MYLRSSRILVTNGNGLKFPSWNSPHFHRERRQFGHTPLENWDLSGRLCQEIWRCTVVCRPGVKKFARSVYFASSNLYLNIEGCAVCLMYLWRIWSIHVYCSWKKVSNLNPNGCEIVRASVTPDIVIVVHCHVLYCSGSSTHSRTVV